MSLERRASVLTWAEQRDGIQGVAAGMHVYAGFDLNRSEAELVGAALEAGVRVYPGSPCCMRYTPEHPSLIIGFGHLNELQIVSGVERLSRGLA